MSHLEPQIENAAVITIVYSDDRILELGDLCRDECGALVSLIELIFEQNMITEYEIKTKTTDQPPPHITAHFRYENNVNYDAINLVIQSMANKHIGVSDIKLQKLS